MFHFESFLTHREIVFIIKLTSCLYIYVVYFYFNHIMNGDLNQFKHVNDFKIQISFILFAL